MANKPTYEQLQQKVNKLEKQVAGYEEKYAKVDQENNLKGKDLTLSYNIFQTVFDNLDAIVFVADFETYEILFANKYTQDIFGDVVGQKYGEKMKEGKKVPFNFCPANRLIDPNGKPKGVYVWETKSPVNNRWYEAHDQAVQWIDKRMVRLEIANDITARKRDEKRLFKLMNLQGLLSKVSFTFNTIDDFYSKMNQVLELIGKYIDVSRVYVFENDETNTFTKNKYEWCSENISPKIDDFQKLYYKEFPILEKLYSQKGIIKAKYISEDLPPELFDRLIPHDIKSILLAPIHINNKFFGFIGVDECTRYRDWHISEINLLRTVSSVLSNAYERKIIEEAIIKSEAKLREANATKDKFFSIIAHDLKNPIHNLINLSEILIHNFDSWDRETTNEFIQYINQSSKQGFNLLENLLEWSRAQTGEIKWHPKEIDLKEIQDTTVNLLSTTAKNKNIDLNTQIEEGMTAYADANMISTVIRNLLSNALKFTEQGGKVTIKAKKTIEFIEITVSDTGIGIDEEDIPKLFRLDVNHTTIGTAQEEGTGLGLILCKEFVEKNGGKIWVESELGKGSDFKFILPVRKSKVG